MPKVKKEKFWKDFPALTRLLAEIELFRAREQSQPSLPFETITQPHSDDTQKTLRAARPGEPKKKTSRTKDKADLTPQETQSDELF